MRELINLRERMLGTLPAEQSLCMAVREEVMPNPTFTFSHAAVVQLHVRVAMPRVPHRRTCGHFVNDRGEVKPIPGAIAGYVNGKPVIAVPLPEPEPSHRKLLPVSIDSLCEADGDVTSAESHDDNDEVVQAESEEPCFDDSVESARALMHDPESIPDEQLETSESSDSEMGDHE
jgi:hypothetical protein